MGYVVARMYNGVAHDWLHDSADGSHTVCILKSAAKVFRTYDEAADAAGNAMDRHHHDEYRALSLDD